MQYSPPRIGNGGGEFDLGPPPPLPSAPAPRIGVVSGGKGGSKVGSFVKTSEARLVDHNGVPSPVPSIRRAEPVQARTFSSGSPAATPVAPAGGFIKVTSDRVAGRNAMAIEYKLTQELARLSGPRGECARAAGEGLYYGTPRSLCVRGGTGAALCSITSREPAASPRV